MTKRDEIAILGLLRRKKPEGLTMDDIRLAAGEVSVTVLDSLVAQGKVEKSVDGLYRAV